MIIFRGGVGALYFLIEGFFVTAGLAGEGATIVAMSGAEAALGVVDAHFGSCRSGSAGFVVNS